MDRDSSVPNHLIKQILAVWGKNTVFNDFSLCAKFNRFFIILGGGGRIHWRNFFPVYPEGPNLDLQIGQKSGFFTYFAKRKI